MISNPDNVRLPYGPPVDWADLSDATKWLVIHYQLSTFSWWIRVRARRR